MGISDSYLAHLVTIVEPQAIYHPRLPAPFPSSIHGVQSPPASTGSSVTSGPIGSPRGHLIDVYA